MIVLILSTLSIITLLILFCICSKESFTIFPDASNSTILKPISEVYSYPVCITGGCITSSSKLKPQFDYNISNNRCIHNNSQDYNISKSDLDNWISYTVGPNVNFTSCQPNTNTVYPYVNGRYIRLLRLDNTPMKLKHISVYNINGENISLNKTIFVNPIYIDSNGNINYADTI